MTGHWITPVPSFIMGSLRTKMVSLAIILLVVPTLWPNPYLIVANDSGVIVKQFYLYRQTEFSLVYRHSVQKTLCWEDFTVANNGDLILEQTRYESLGVGLPFLPGEGKFTNLDGKFYLTGLNRRFSELGLRAMPVAEQALVVGDQVVKLNDTFPPGALIIIKTRRLSLLQSLYNRISIGRVKLAG